MSGYKTFCLKGLKPIIEINDELNEVHGTSPSLATVYDWVNEFKCGCVLTQDEPRSRRPVEVTTPEMIDKIQDLVLS